MAQDINYQVCQALNETLSSQPNKIIEFLQNLS
jgi:hypothetical protein